LPAWHVDSKRAGKTREVKPGFQRTNCFRRKILGSSWNDVDDLGLPMIEGSMARKPVLVNRSAIAQEILRDYPLYFEQSESSLSEAVDRIEDPAIYRAQCDRLEGFDWPDWQQTVPMVLDALVSSRNCWASLPQFIGPSLATPTDKGPSDFCASGVTDFDASHTAR